MNLNLDIKEKLASYYKGKKILITGGLGFIGSNLAIQLVSLEASIALLDNMNPDYGSNFFNIQTTEEGPIVVWQWRLCSS